jgi:hypothetical protein
MIDRLNPRGAPAPADPAPDSPSRPSDRPARPGPSVNHSANHLAERPSGLPQRRDTERAEARNNTEPPPRTASAALALHRGPARDAGPHRLDHPGPQRDPMPLRDGTRPQGAWPGASATRTHEPGPAPAGSSAEPALDPQEHPLLKLRVQLYGEALQNLEALCGSGELRLSATGQHAFGRMAQSHAELQALLPYLLEGRDPPPGGSEALRPVRARIHAAIHERRCRNALCELVVAQPAVLVPLVRNADLLSILAADLGHELAAARQALRSSAPEVMDCVDRLSTSMHDAMDDARREAQLHRDVLQLLGATVEGAAQARADAHRHGLGGWLGRRADQAVGRLAAQARVPVTPPEAYGTGLQTELAMRFGRLFDIGVEGERRVSVRPRSGVEGYFSTAELLATLQAMNDYVGRRRDRRAVQAAIQASPDLQWVTVDGQAELQLTPQALVRLGAAATPHDDVPEATAQQRMQLSIIGGVQGLKLSDLKAALVQTFREDIARLAARAAGLLNLNPGLTQAKAALLQGLVDDLVAAPTVAMMLAQVDEAIAAHERLWQADRFARDAGSTGVLLAELREALQRYDGMPP